jgi:hypothetical protein
MVQSLIVPAVEYQPVKRYRLSTSKADYTIRFGRLIEQQPDWIWTAIEPLQPGSKAAVPQVAPGSTLQ